MTHPTLSDPTIGEGVLEPTEPAPPAEPVSDWLKVVIVDAWGIPIDYHPAEFDIGVSRY